MSFERSALPIMRRAFCFLSIAAAAFSNALTSRALHSLAVALIGLALLGCQRSQPRADLVIVNSAEPGSLDPATSTGLEELRIVMALFEGLMRVDPKDARAVPGIAERYEVSADGRIYTFHLRTNAQWSTGGRITAHDFLYSWLRVLNPATASEYADQLFYIKNAEAWYKREIKDPSQLGIKVIGDLTLRVELNNPTAFFPDLCAFQTLAVVPREAIERNPDHWMRTAPVPVSGPYQLDSWRVNDRVRLRANPRYWDATNTQCQLVDILPLRSPGTAFNLYHRGAVDIIWDKDLIPADVFPTLRGRPDFHSFTYLATYFLRFNTTRKPFDDPRIRQALTMAIDKSRLVEKILKSGEPVAAQLVPPGTANSLPADGLPYDPEAARRLLKDAGYPGGAGLRTIEYLFEAISGGGVSIHARIGVELQQMWQRELGVKIELRQMEKQVYLKAQRSLDYDVSRSSWIGDYNDPSTFLNLFVGDNGNNRTGWKNARYDDLIREANLQTDMPRRARLLRDAETLLLRDGTPIAPLYFYNGFNYYNPTNVSGIWGNILDIHPVNTIRKIARAR